MAHTTFPFKPYLGLSLGVFGLGFSPWLCSCFPRTTVPRVGLSRPTSLLNVLYSFSGNYQGSTTWVASRRAGPFPAHPFSHRYHLTGFSFIMEFLVFVACVSHTFSPCSSRSLVCFLEGFALVFGVISVFFFLFSLACGFSAIFRVRG